MDSKPLTVKRQSRSSIVFNQQAFYQHHIKAHPPTKFFNLILCPLVVVSSHRDPQLQVYEKYIIMYNLN